MERYSLNESEIRLKKELESEGYEFIDDGIHKPVIKKINPPLSKDFDITEDIFKCSEETAKAYENYLDYHNNPYFRDTNNCVHWSSGLFFDVTVVR